MEIHAIPDWEGYLSSLQETLEGILFEIEQDRHMGVRADIACLEAYDTLNQFLDAVKGELGIL